MKKKRTQEEFIKRANIIHNYFYDYNKSIYKGTDIKIIIICPIHGEFLQTPHHHLAKHGCKKCNYSNKPINENFIEKAKEKHGEKYDYSLVKYINNHLKIIIICPKHGQFLQQPNNHLNGNGCQKCKKYKYNINTLIDKFNKIHNFKYDYSKINYTNSSTKICIICPKHKDFWQVPSAHLTGYGCYKCNGNIPLTTEEFIKKVKLFRGNIYDYSKTKYINRRTKVIIICKTHGEFLQYPDKHILGANCKKCIISLIPWNFITWKNKALVSKRFDSFKVYIIRCFNENEEFYKIGKTFLKINKRFTKYSLPYNYEIIKIYESKTQFRRISKLENKLQKENYKFKYQPNIKFPGWNECFSKLN